MAYLDKSALRRETLKRKTLHVPALGGDVLLRELTSPEVAAFREYAKASQEGDAHFRLVLGPARLIRCAWITEDGSPVLDEGDEMLLHGHSPTEVLEPLVLAISELSGLEKAALDDAKKNLPATQNGASGSGLPSPSEAAP